MDGNAFGKNSRFMNTLKFSDVTKRRVRAFNVVENKLNTIRLKFYKRQEEIEYNRIQREKEFLLVKLKRLMAYQKVAEEHSVSNAVNYQDALNEDRSHRQVQKQIQDMIKEISPQYLREKRAKEKITAAKQQYDEILNKNRKDIDKIYPPPKVRGSYFTGDDGDEIRSNVTTPKSAPPEMNAEMRMRRMTMANTRRVIGFTRAFVMEKSNLGEKLEKEKTTINDKTSAIQTTQEEATETSRTEPVEVLHQKRVLPPVLVKRTASMNDVTKHSKRQKRPEKQTLKLPPVAVTKTIHPELDIRRD